MSAVAPLFRHWTTVALANLIRRELLFEYPLRVIGEVVDGPLIKVLELLFQLGRQIELDSFARCRFIVEGCCPKWSSDWLGFAA